MTTPRDRGFASILLVRGVSSTATSVATTISPPGRTPSETPSATSGATTPSTTAHTRDIRALGRHFDVAALEDALVQHQGLGD